MGVQAVVSKITSKARNLPIKKGEKPIRTFLSKVDDSVGDTFVLRKAKKAVIYVKGRTIGRMKTFGNSAVDEIRKKRLLANEKKNPQMYKIMAPITGTIKGFGKEVKVDDLPILTAGLGIAVPLPLMTTLGFFIGEGCVRAGKFLCKVIKKV